MSNPVYKEYNPETLKRLQNVELEILRDFIKISERNNINYFLIAGSAIGCAREGNMIGWDDDIDLGLLREDYEKLLEVYRFEFNDKYTLYSPDTENKYYNFVPNMSLNGTKFIIELSSGLYEPGIFMDLFVFENIPDDLKEAKKHIKKCLFWRNLYVASRSNLKYIKNEGVVQCVKYYFSIILRLFFKTFDRDGDWLYHRYLSLAKKYYQKTNTYTLLGDPFALRNIVTRDEIFPLKTMTFNNLNVNMMNEYDVYLTRRFGDYMIPPKEENRVNHAPIVLEFEEK